MSEAGAATYLVTGAAGGIGQAVCERLLEDGGHVIGTDRCSSFGTHDQLDWVIADIGSADDRQMILSRCAGPLQGIVMAAGVLDPGKWDEIGEAEIHQLLSINIVAPIMLIRALVPSLADGASIVFLGSIAAIRSAPATPFYAASKAALHSLGASLAVLLLERGIRVNVLAPGLIDTPLTARLNREMAAASGQHLAAIERSRTEAIPMGRAGTPGEVADACAFLLGDQSSYMTGSTLFLTGGAMAGAI